MTLSNQAFDVYVKHWLIESNQIAEFQYRKKYADIIHTHLQRNKKFIKKRNSHFLGFKYFCLEVLKYLGYSTRPTAYFEGYNIITYKYDDPRHIEFLNNFYHRKSKSFLIWMNEGDQFEYETWKRVYPYI